MTKQKQELNWKKATHPCKTLAYKMPNEKMQWLLLKKLFGSVYFTTKMLTATNQVELLCRQSKI